MKSFKIAFFAFLFMMTGVANAAVHTFSGADTWSSGVNTATANVGFDTSWDLELTKTLKTFVEFSTTDFESVLGSGVYDTQVSVYNGATEIFGDWILSPRGTSTFMAVLGAGIYTLNMSSASGGIPSQGGSYAVGVITTETPIPAAVWLFGSALMGLFGASRRKSSAMAA